MPFLALLQFEKEKVICNDNFFGVGFASKLTKKTMGRVLKNVYGLPRRNRPSPVSCFIGGQA